MATWPRDYQQFPGFSTAVTVPTLGHDWPSNQVRRKRVGLGGPVPVLPSDRESFSPASPPSTLFAPSSIFLSPRSFLAAFVALTLFTAAALTASHSFLHGRLSYFDNVKDVTSTIAIR